MGAYLIQGMILLDSNIYIYVALGKKGACELYQNEATAMSTITAMELYDGSLTADEEEQEFIKDLLETETILPFTKEIALMAGELRAERRKYGKTSRRQVADVIIAATAIAHNIPLLTANEKDFKKYKGLKLVTFKP